MALKNNILSLFRRELRSFGFGEVECPTIMPEIVWKASGHLERFIDPVFRCRKCNTLFRADKFLQEKLPEQLIDGLSFKTNVATVDRLIPKFLRKYFVPMKAQAKGAAK